MSSSAWTWDPARRKYYIYSDGKYTYEDGQIIQTDNGSQSYEEGAGPSEESRQGLDPRRYPEHVAFDPAGDVEQYGSPDVYDSGRFSDSKSRNQRLSSGSFVEDEEDDDEEEEEDDDDDQADPSNMDASDADYVSGIHQFNDLEQQLEERNMMEPKIGAAQQEGQLNKKYRLIPMSKAKDFFKVGRVFRTAWAEPAGFSSSSKKSKAPGRDEIYSPLGEKIHSKIRWFVVVVSLKQNCWCLPINTYGDQGVGKRGVIKSEYSIIYTGSTEPQPSKNERPLQGEDPMLPGIRVEKSSRQEKLHDMSRICYSKIYNFEYNLKANDFGVVHKKSIETLLANFGGFIAHVMPGMTNSSEREMPYEQPDYASNQQNYGSNSTYPETSQDPYLAQTFGALTLQQQQPGWQNENAGVENEDSNEESDNDDEVFERDHDDEEKVPESSSKSRSRGHPRQHDNHGHRSSGGKDVESPERSSRSSKSKGKSRKDESHQKRRR